MEGYTIFMNSKNVSHLTQIDLCRSVHSTQSQLKAATFNCLNGHWQTESKIYIEIKKTKNS